MMSINVLYTLAGVVLFATGLYALIAYSHLLRRILAINVSGSGVFLSLVAMANRVPNAAPDPVPHAMVLTGIVVAARVAAAITAELGTMQVKEQIDALRALGVSPVRYLVIPRFVAAFFMLPLLTILANIIGFWGRYCNEGLGGIA